MSAVGKGGATLGGAAVQAAISALAGPQHGVVARRQLVAAGIPTHMVDWRVKGGWLRPVHRGVYQVGPVEAPRARLMAACLACGPGAVVSHRSAAALWGVLPHGRPGVPVHVTVLGARRSHRGVCVHRSATLLEDEVTTADGVPVSVLERTLLDLAGDMGPRDLERALAEGVALRLTTTGKVRRLARRHLRQRGASRLRRILDRGRPALARSEAEERFLGLVRRAQLEAPVTNTPVEGFEVDFLWRAQGLVVEIDGFAFHSSKKSFESDRRRDAVLAAKGMRVMRVTWRQLVDEPEAVLVRLARALAVAGPR